MSNFIIKKTKQNKNTNTIHNNWILSTEINMLLAISIMFKSSLDSVSRTSQKDCYHAEN